MLYPIKKIDSVPVKDSTGAIKKNPTTGETIKEKKVLDEAIDVWLVKSVRPFHKGNSYKDIEGEVSVVYIFPADGKPAVEMHIIGNWLKIISDINELRGGERKIMATD